jgi:hypothetical protein
MTDEKIWYQCFYCSDIFEDEESRETHIFENHMDEVDEKLSQIQSIAQENSQTLQEWKNEKKKELLLKIATENPRLLHEIQVSPHSDEMLDKEVEMELFKKALHTNSLDSFSAMWLRHPKFEEISKAERSKPKHEARSGQSTGQDETFYESPDAMIDTTKRTNTRENLSEEDMKKLQLVKILFSIMRNQKKKD